MKTFIPLITLALLMLGSLTKAQQPSKWEGEIFVLNQTIPFKFDFDKAEKGVMNIPVQGAYNLKIHSKTWNDSLFLVRVDTTTSNMLFKARPGEGDTIKGMFSQSGFEGQFHLFPATETQETYSWIEKEVRFSHDSITLAGSLSIPDSSKAYPAVIFISGSGQQDRDENIYGFRIFKQLVPAFIDKGIAVLRFDDRGAGESDEGNVQEADSRDFADDVAAAYRYLSRHPNIDSTAIGMLGHSEGGLIAPMVAQRYQPAFLILMAGPTVPGKEILLEQARMLLKTEDSAKEEVDELLENYRMIYDEILKEKTDTNKIKDIYRTIFNDGSPVQDSSLYEHAISAAVNLLTTPWLQFFLSYNPQPALENLDMPVLAVFGGKDLQVTEQQNRPFIDTLIEQGKDNFQIKTYPEANHLFQKAETGNPAEYESLKKAFVNGFANDLAMWVQAVLIH